jgi:TPP-dependent pyruvate/acetoin dehydrogenase alpha subunit
LVYSIKKTILKNIYKKIRLIRSVEQRIAQKYQEQKMRCPVHLSIGQEMAPSVLSLFTTKNDPCVSTHRGHAHYLAKGGNLKKMISEIYGKKTGCSKGKGGSMHLVDKSVGFYGTSAIVGNSIPVGVGLSYILKLKKKKNFSLVYLGDGAVEEGVFYESLNLAATKNLPVLFICENNLYSVYSPLDVRQPKHRRIYKMVREIGIKSYKCDGNDLKMLFKIFKNITKLIRNTHQPCFLELSNYRWLEHCGPNFDNNLNYRSLEEYKKWKKKDKLQNLRNNLIQLFNKKVICSIDSQINKKIDDAFHFAEVSNFPHKKEIFKDIYKV